MRRKMELARSFRGTIMKSLLRNIKPSIIEQFALPFWLGLRLTTECTQPLVQCQEFEDPILSSQLL